MEFLGHAISSRLPTTQGTESLLSVYTGLGMGTDHLDSLWLTSGTPPSIRIQVNVIKRRVHIQKKAQDHFREERRAIERRRGKYVMGIIKVKLNKKRSPLHEVLCSVVSSLLYLYPPIRDPAEIRKLNRRQTAGIPTSGLKKPTSLVKIEPFIPSMIIPMIAVTLCFSLY